MISQRRHWRLPALALWITILVAAPPARACDLCSIFAASEARGEVGRGFFSGVAEQFTHFGTLQEDGHEIPSNGQYIDGSISQLFAGYNFSSRFGVQFNLPLIYRSFGSATQHGTESGLGDVSLLGTFVPYSQLTESHTLMWTLLGGVKFPTGDSSRLGEPDSAFPEGIAGHDIALGSGSYDGIVGTSLSASWHRTFLSASAQYAIRSEGDFHHQYADDLTWQGGPGYYLALEDRYTLALQAVVSGEYKGKDTFNGEPDDDSAATMVYLGPQINFTWSDKLSVQVGVDVPVSRYNSGVQVVPDYRVRAALTWRF